MQRAVGLYGVVLTQRLTSSPSLDKQGNTCGPPRLLSRSTDTLSAPDISHVRQEAQSAHRQPMRTRRNFRCHQLHAVPYPPPPPTLLLILAPV